MQVLFCLSYSGLTFSCADCKLFSQVVLEVAVGCLGHVEKFDLFIYYLFIYLFIGWLIDLYVGDELTPGSCVIAVCLCVAGGYHRKC